ncbi:hypothetical protein TNCT_732401 [Trichonephila clavata]|uniref:Uncharacterized protein n=1 Tax=Trichonephila clavata TaxID=2740835 RepID=A0A8X6HSJ4_TRICU|nr:hypothetical protein TNCT_732401 [Trichonephila clavata]
MQVKRRKRRRKIHKVASEARQNDDVRRLKTHCSITASTCQLPDPIILHDPRGNFIAKRCSSTDRHVPRPPAHLSSFGKSSHRSCVTSLFARFFLGKNLFLAFPSPVLHLFLWVSIRAGKSDYYDDVILFIFRGSGVKMAIICQLFRLDLRSRKENTSEMGLDSAIGGTRSLPKQIRESRPLFFLSPRWSELFSDLWT